MKKSKIADEVLVSGALTRKKNNLKMSLCRRKNKMLSIKLKNAITFNYFSNSRRSLLAVKNI